MKRSVILFVFYLNCLNPIEGFGSVKNWVKQRLPLPVRTILRSTTDRGVSNPLLHTEHPKNNRASDKNGNTRGNELTIIPPPVENGPLAFLHFIKADVLFVQILKIVENFFLGLLKLLGGEDDEDIEGEGTAADGRRIHGSKRQEVLKSKVYEGKCTVAILTT